ncbi:hypothetical protein [Lichenibacterium dinghuense]|uniref:hypothetical protein n=1 Tax=Lichenibacterium dinghuense TaxID=2895977 RepID=UPI001F177FE4|nr:hypothetical protein [Lichenibacterium sp. 6Y81]
MRIPYTSVRGGKRFFEPRGRMVAEGFRPRSLGPDDERARREAWRLYEDRMATRDGRAPAPEPAASGRASKEAVSLGRRYPRGSIGAAWQEWIRTEEWGALALSNRTKIWWPAWEKRIEPVFGDVRPDSIAWRATVAGEFGVDAAHKAMKVWRALWGVLQALRYTQLTDPSKKVTNTAPKPRNVRHEFASALHLAKTAWRRGIADWPASSSSAGTPAFSRATPALLWRGTSAPTRSTAASSSTVRRTAAARPARR